MIDDPARSESVSVIGVNEYFMKNTSPWASRLPDIVSHHSPALNRVLSQYRGQAGNHNDNKPAVIIDQKDSLSLIQYRFKEQESNLSKPSVLLNQLTKHPRHHAGPGDNQTSRCSLAKKPTDLAPARIGIDTRSAKKGPVTAAVAQEWLCRCRLPSGVISLSHV